MTSIAAPVMGKTVLPRLTVVNTFVPVDTETPDTAGSRLRQFIDARWSRRHGGIRGLAKRLGVSPESMYEWFNNEREPNLDQLARLALVLSSASGSPVSRAEILAAMDGGVPLAPVDAETEARLTELVTRLLDERLGPR